MSLRSELAAVGVRVVVIRPGPVDTPFREHATRAEGMVGYDAPDPKAQSADVVARKTVRAVLRRHARHRDEQLRPRRVGDLALRAFRAPPRAPPHGGQVGDLRSPSVLRTEPPPWEIRRCAPTGLRNAGRFRCGRRHPPPHSSLSTREPRTLTRTPRLFRAEASGSHVGGGGLTRRRSRGCHTLSRRP